MSRFRERLRKLALSIDPDMEERVKLSRQRNLANDFLRNSRHPIVFDSKMPVAAEDNYITNSSRAIFFFLLLPDAVQQFTYRGQVYYRLQTIPNIEASQPWNEEDLIAHLKLKFGAKWNPPGIRG